MKHPPMSDDWPGKWHLAAHLDQLTASDAIEITVAGISLQVRYEESALTARGDACAYPLMVVDDEIFVLLDDGPD